MLKILVCFYSRTGTTKEMAEEVVKGVNGSETGVEAVLKKVSEVNPSRLDEYAGLVLGSPTYYGLPSAQIKKLLDESVSLHGELEGMVGGAFSSSAQTAGGNETAIIALLEALLIHGMVVQGQFDGNHYGPVVVGQASEEELEECKRYGELLAELTERVR